MILVLFKLVTPSQITTSRTSQITESKISYFSWFDSASTTPLRTSLRLRFPCTYSLPTPRIHSTSGRIRIWSPVRSLWWGFHAEAVNVLRPYRLFL